MAISLTLTPRETQVTQLVCQGLRNCQIAERLGISVKTVDVHRYNAYIKLGVHNVAQLIHVLHDRALLNAN